MLLKGDDEISSRNSQSSECFAQSVLATARSRYEFFRSEGNRGKTQSRSQYCIFRLQRILLGWFRALRVKLLILVHRVEGCRLHVCLRILHGVWLYRQLSRYFDRLLLLLVPGRLWFLSVLLNLLQYLLVRLETYACIVVLYL